MIYYFNVEGMGCGLGEARDLEAAKQKVQRENGTYPEQRVRKATKEDIAWVTSMGGWLPESIRK